MKLINAQKVNIEWKRFKVVNKTDVMQWFNLQAKECKNSEICFKCMVNITRVVVIMMFWKNV